MRKHTVKLHGIGKKISRTILASTVMGSITYLVYRLCVALLGTGYVRTLIALGISFVVAVVAYFATVAVLNGTLGSRRVKRPNGELAHLNSRECGFYDMTVGASCTEAIASEDEDVEADEVCIENNDVSSDNAIDTFIAFDETEECVSDGEPYTENEFTDFAEAEADIPEDIEEQPVNKPVYRDYIEEIDENDYL